MTSASTARVHLPANVTIRCDLKPGDVGYITYLHGVLYAMEHGWDYTFDAYVAGPLAEFVKSHTGREQIWIVEKDGEIAGSVAIVEVSGEQAQLRWLLLHPDLRGQGIGRILVEEAITFCRARDYSSVFLWTVSVLAPATNLYKSVGFELSEEKAHEAWGALVTEQRYDLKLRCVLHRLRASRSRVRLALAAKAISGLQGRVRNLPQDKRRGDSLLAVPSSALRAFAPRAPCGASDAP